MSGSAGIECVWECVWECRHRVCLGVLSGTVSVSVSGSAGVECVWECCLGLCLGVQA